jgi:hypothetical protein
MVSVLAIGAKICGFTLGQGNGCLKAIKICSMPSLGGEVKLEAASCIILWNVKKSVAGMNRNNLQGEIYHSFACSSFLIPDGSAGRIARERWWTNQEFSCQFHSCMVLHAHIIWVMNSGCISET